MVRFNSGKCAAGLTNRYDMRRLIVLGLLALSACGSPRPQPVEPGPLVVSVAQVHASTDVVRIAAAGTVRLRQETNLGFTSPGRIARIAVNAGDHVAKGQLLATLDMTTVVAQLGAASAEQLRAAAIAPRQGAAGRWLGQPRARRHGAGRLRFGRSRHARPALCNRHGADLCAQRGGGARAAGRAVASRRQRNSSDRAGRGSTRLCAQSALVRS